MTNKEEWKPIKGFEGMYEVSNRSRVRVLMRRVRFGKGYRYTEEHILTPRQNTRYVTIGLYKNGTQTSKTLHRLVAEAFIPKVEGKNCINHIDENGQNNDISNLEWCTHRENTHHSIKRLIESIPKGEDFIASKLKENQVLEIRKLYKTGDYYQRELATVFGVARTTIENIIHRNSWKHI